MRSIHREYARVWLRQSITVYMYVIVCEHFNGTKCIFKKIISDVWLRNLCDVIFNLSNTMRLSDLFLYHASTLQALKDNDPAYYLQLVARLRLSIRSQGEWPIDWH